MKNILIVDDQKSIQKLIEAILTKINTSHRVFFADNGREALKVIAARKIDLVITDIFMPDLDGIELINLISDMAGKPRIIALTGKNEFGLDYLDVAQILGADFCVKKRELWAKLPEMAYSCLAATA
jgi:CheY-like chemotaxis protein